jgi:hypothetical protein
MYGEKHSNTLQEISGMDRGSDFECEFRARRIRVRGNFAHKLFSEIIHRRCTPMRYMPMRSTPMKYTPMRYTHEIYAYEMHAYETHAKMRACTS